MTSTFIAAVNLLIIFIGVSRYLSTINLMGSAILEQNAKEAETLAPPVPIRIRTSSEKRKQEHLSSSLSPTSEQREPAFCPKCRYKYSSESCKNRAKFLAKKYTGGDLAEARQKLYREHPTHCRQQQINISAHDLCFVTAEFSDAPTDMDSLPILDEDMRTDPPRHFVFTNQPSLSAPLGWRRIVLDEVELPYRRQITKSRWPKFMGWQHPSLQHCEVVFYGDAYLMNPINETNWLEMARDIKQNPVGLMQDKQIGLSGNNKPITELRKVAKEGKLSTELSEKTITWLLNQSDYDEDAIVYKNAIFGYDPHNAKVQQLMHDFWSIYAKEELSWRDQPIWSYLMARERMRPLHLHRKGGKIFGEFGQKGHGGHVYVPQNILNVPAKPKKKDRFQNLSPVPKFTDAEYEICFITSVFANNTKQADRVGNVTHLRNANPNFQYYAFTNQADMETPGWEKIVQADLPYKRMITQSRLAKFVSWKVDVIREKCGVVFVSDGHLIPKSSRNATELFRQQARKVKLSRDGLAQWQHKIHNTYKKLAWSIGAYRKDSKEHVKQTMAQLANFSDFREEETVIYWNQVLAYDPNNPFYIGASDRFWELYSQEYGSWRDQLLWAYVMDSFGMQPRKLKKRKHLYDVDEKAKGYGGHVHVDRKKR